jgi:hypothetical protein
MKRSLVTAIALASLLAGPASAQLSHEPFRIPDTRSLIELCSAAESDPLYDDAINFCHGYVAGAWQYHEAQANGPQGRRLVCLPDPPPTRIEAIAMFLEWSKSHPEHASEPAVETMFRFLIGKWPCPEPAAEKGGAK